ncbi:hypothetical protein CKM354_001048200 [Cercospora kikuchii]|uniref:Uncharacterized protein n=1 Tax=Cercospora kikuchii TaxID=84275 RepID=A0A9P3CR29_9PEZI|nr:uncharacterized protein CKM354_001048200 [Cercospora kikuchii]GIZ47389.1 hypothetical protein CKM354_001048200 [Cercospora kikuchii]
MANEALLQVQRQREQTLQRASAEFDKAEKEARQEWFSAVKNFGEKQPFQSWLIQSLQAPRYIQSYNERGTAQGAYDQVQLQIQGQGYQNTMNERQRAEGLAVIDRQREDQKFLDDPSKRDSGEKEIEKHQENMGQDLDFVSWHDKSEAVQS